MNLIREENLPDIIDEVLHYLDSHRRKAAEVLFPGLLDDQVAYRREWIERKPLAFWFHLDGGNRTKLVKAARAFYADRRDNQPTEES